MEDHAKAETREQRRSLLTREKGGEKKIKNGDVRTEGRMRDDAPRTYAISGGGRLFGA